MGEGSDLYKSVSFYYHMHGATMGALSLQVQVGGKWRTVWSKKGNQQSQASKFIMAKVYLPSSTTSVQFVGVKGASYTGDMAIDSIVFGSAAKPCIGDFNADKVVDAKDLLNLLGRFAAANSHKYTGTDAGKRIKPKKFSGK